MPEWASPASARGRSADYPANTPWHRVYCVWSICLSTYSSIYILCWYPLGSFCSGQTVGIKAVWGSSNTGKLTRNFTCLNAIYSWYCYYSSSCCCTYNNIVLWFVMMIGVTGCLLLKYDGFNRYSRRGVVILSEKKSIFGLLEIYSRLFASRYPGGISSPTHTTLPTSTATKKKKCCCRCYLQIRSRSCLSIQYYLHLICPYY